MWTMFAVLLSAFLIFHSGFADASTRSSASRETFIQHLLERMSPEEKVGQLRMRFVGYERPESEVLQTIGKGQTGAMFGMAPRPVLRMLQEAAVNHSRLGIPLFFGFDVVHGHRTIFPISLALASSWDMEAISRSARIAALEASADGLDLTFAPTVDLSRDPRWGRVAEGLGEDPYLASRIASVMVKAFQGIAPDKPGSIMACAKHFALYGAVEGGRDYNNVDMSLVQMYQYYFAPYRAAIDAGAGAMMVMLGSINNVPASADSWLLRKVLRQQMGFSGLTISDHGAVEQLIEHGVARNGGQAAQLAISAGVDISMSDTFYGSQLPAQIRSGQVSRRLIDEAVYKVLAAKYDMGLFEDPFRRIGKALDDPVDPHSEGRLHRAQARDVARRTFVLLKNRNAVLPLAKKTTIAVVGPLAKSTQDMLGTWSAIGDKAQAVSVYEGLERVVGSAALIYARGANVTEDKDVIAYLGPSEIEIDPRPASVMIEEAVQAVRKAEVIVAVVGEARGMSHEGASRTSLDLPGHQPELIQALKATGKPLVLLLMNGRPLSIGKELELADAVLETWYAGTEGGNAIADVLFGDYNPSAKLVMTFPRTVGQIPSYYNHLNTGRPYRLNEERNYTSQYFDATYGPLFSFGYGLSYTEFSLSQMALSSNVMPRSGGISVSVNLANTGQRDGETVVQLYIRDVVASISRPVKELKNFQKVMLKAGEQKVIQFTLDENDLKFYDAQLHYVAEPGEFKVQVGLDSQNVKEQSFELR